jgi:TolA-binding protein
MHIFLILAYFLTLSFSAFAQDRTLMDIRTELGVLDADIEGLRGLLSEETEVSRNRLSSGTLERIYSIEIDLKRIILQVERLESRVVRVVKDGTEQVSSLKFRLCQLEESCNVESSSNALMLGEIPFQAYESIQKKKLNQELTLKVSPTQIPARDLTIGETDALTEAKRQIAKANPEGAIINLQFLLTTYPNGPLALDIKFLLGEVYMMMKEWGLAAEIYLDNYSSFPNSPRAGEALYKLGISFTKLGQNEEACLMLNQLELQFPNSMLLPGAREGLIELKCS